ncbi:MAG: XdhC family protein [Pirellulales bacterium]
MKKVITSAIEAIQDGRSAAYCRLVETRGSTPQKAGAAMLVFANGNQVGTLGGGCVEAEVRRRAMASLVTGAAEIATFQLDHDYGWDDGLICGGRMTSIVVPLHNEKLCSYFMQLAEVAENGGGTEAIAFDEQQATLAVPFSVLFDSGGQFVSAMPQDLEDDAAVAIRARLRSLSDRPKPYVESGVAYLPMLPRCRLIIVGGGHIGKAVGDIAAELDFDVWIVEDRPEFASAERFPRAQRCIIGKNDDVLPDIDVTQDTYCLIVTRGHNNDARALFHLADRGARYVGLIGSRRKIKLIFEELAEQNVSSAALANVFAPVGVDIGSQTVAEIAVSIAAELVSHRNRGGEVPGRPQPIPVIEEVAGRE